MGYTHYWTFQKPKTIKGKHKEIEAKYQLAVRQCQRIVKSYNKIIKAKDKKHPDRLSGYSAHTKIEDYLGLHFNGTQDLAHEDFSLRDHWSNCFDRPRAPKGFNFCKTANKPYDVVVVACLITLQHYLGDLIEVGSDGDASDWVDGLVLARKALNMKRLTIPSAIERRLEVVV